MLVIGSFFNAIRREVERLFDAVRSAPLNETPSTPLLWFSLTFSIYITIIFIASRVAVVGYVNEAAVPFVEDVVDDLRFVSEEESTNSYDVETLLAVANEIDKEIERLKEEDLAELEGEMERIVEKGSSTNIDDGSVGVGPGVEEEISVLSRKVARVQGDIEELMEERDRVVERIELLNKEVLTVLEKEKLRPSREGESQAYVLAMVKKSVREHFDAERTSAFAVKSVPGFWGGGVIVNQVFVTHWLWYAPMLIAVLYVLDDLMRKKTQLRAEKTEGGDEDVLQ